MMSGFRFHVVRFVDTCCIPSLSFTKMYITTQHLSAITSSEGIVYLRRCHTSTLHSQERALTFQCFMLYRNLLLLFIICFILTIAVSCNAKDGLGLAGFSDHHTDDCKPSARFGSHVKLLAPKFLLLIQAIKLTYFKTNSRSQSVTR